MSEWLAAHWIDVLIVPAVLFVLHTALRIQRRQDKHEQVLFGAKGDNGMCEDVKELRRNKHDQVNKLVAIRLRLHAVERACNIENEEERH